MKEDKLRMSRIYSLRYCLFVLFVCFAAGDTESNDANNVTQSDILEYLIHMKRELNTQLGSLEASIDKTKADLLKKVDSMEKKMETLEQHVSPSESEADNMTSLVPTVCSGINAVQGTVLEDIRSDIDELKNSSKREHELLVEELMKYKEYIDSDGADDNASCNSHMGKEYIVMFPASFGSVQSVELMISTLEDTEVSLESPFPGVNRTVTVTADNGAIVKLPPEIAQSGNCIEHKGVLLRSPSDMFVSGIVQTSGNKGDAYGAIPVKNLGTSYIYAGYFKSFLSIVAFDDNTHVNITIGNHRPQTYSDKPYSSGDTIKIYLSRLSTFQLLGNNYLLNIKVDSTMKIGVVTGSTCFDTYQGFNAGYCNTWSSYLPPTDTMGQSFIYPQVSLANYTYPFLFSEYGKSGVFDFRGRNYRVSSSYNGYDGRGNRRANVPYTVKTTIPTLLTQVTTRYESSKFPSQTLIPAISQFSNNYRFITPTTRSFDNYATIMIKSDDVSGLRFDGKTIYAMKSDVKAIADDTSLYNVISLNITSGQHDVRHVDDDVTFGLVVQGFSSAQTYGFPAGLRLGSSQNCTKVKCLIV